MPLPRYNLNRGSPRIDRPRAEVEARTGAFLHLCVAHMDDSLDKRTRLANMVVSREIHLPPPLGLGFEPSSRILQACRTPTDTHQINWLDLDVRIYSRASGDHVDVVGVGESSDPWRTMFAFQVFSDLCKDSLDELTPLQIVEQMADRFGLTMSVGGKTGKFFLREELPIPTNIGTQISRVGLFHIDNSEDHPCFLVSAVNAGASTIRVAMAFCIDITKYGEWITSR